jgi:hypothetical protein
MLYAVEVKEVEMLMVVSDLRLEILPAAVLEGLLWSELSSPALFTLCFACREQSELAAA